MRLETGDRVTLVCEGDQVVMMNSAVYAMRMLKQDMKGEAERVGLVSDDDIDRLVKDVRAEMEGL